VNAFMAKKKTSGGGAGSTLPTRVESAVVEFAEDLGKLLGTAQAKAEGWMNQRKAVADQLAQIRDTANRYLLQLTGTSKDGAAPARGARRGRPPGSVSKATGRGARKRRPLSAEAREKIAAAQRARWAKQKSAKNAK
jgi:hypothetical protein